MDEKIQFVLCNREKECEYFNIQDDLLLRKRIENMSEAEKKTSWVTLDNGEKKFSHKQNGISAWKFDIKQGTNVYSIHDQFCGYVAERYLESGKVMYQIIDEGLISKPYLADELEKVCRIVDHTVLIPYEHMLWDKEVVLTKAFGQKGLYIFLPQQWNEVSKAISSMENTNLRRFMMGSALEYSLNHGMLELPEILYLYMGLENCSKPAILIPEKVLNIDCYLLTPAGHE